MRQGLRPKGVWGCAGIAVTLLALTLVGVGGVRAELPKGKDPKAYTQHDVVRELLDFNRKTIGDAYREGGRRNAKWDAEVQRALERLARYFTFNPQHAIYATERVEHEELRAAAQAAVDKGCDDPMVLYALVVAKHDAGDKSGALPLLKQAFDGISKSKYSAYRIFAVANKLRDNSPSAEERGAAYTVMREQSLKMAAGPFVNRVHRRRVLATLEELCSARDSDAREELFGRLQGKADVDPWILNVWAGSCYIQRAWAARGSGWANTVTEQGWAGFFDNMGKARTSLVKAWELHPDLPEAPTHLITVAMGAGQRFNETPRQWFERALTAQLDHQHAYEIYGYARLPRWGGTYNEIYAVGKEALETGRFDTLVPWEFVLAVRRIAQDSDDLRGWQDPQIHKTVVDLTRRYAEACKHSQYTADWFRTYHAAMEWRLGRMQEARQALEGVAQVSEGAFEQWGGEAVEAVGMIYALTGPAEQHVRKGLRLEEAKDYGAAAEAYRLGVAAVKPEDREHVYVQARLAEVERQAKLDSGEWVDILPKAGFEGWGLMDGNALIGEDGKSVVLVSDGGEFGARLAGNTDYGRRYEVQAVAEFPPGNRRTGLGISVDAMGPYAYHSLVLFSDGRVRKQTNREVVEGMTPVAASNRIVIEYWDGLCRASVNGKTIPDRLVATPERERNELRLYCGIRTAETTVVIKELKVRKLKERPAGLVEAGE